MHLDIEPLPEGFQRAVLRPQRLILVPRRQLDAEQLVEHLVDVADRLFRLVEFGQKDHRAVGTQRVQRQFDHVVVRYGIQPRQKRGLGLDNGNGAINKVHGKSFRIDLQRRSSVGAHCNSDRPRGEGRCSHMLQSAPLQ
ncbi:hypothetical protein D3C85_1555340 [compost metagenome]